MTNKKYYNNKRSRNIAKFKNKTEKLPGFLNKLAKLLSENF